MEFTYSGYQRLIDLLRENKYTFSDYVNCSTVNRPVILRHDIDMSLSKALEFAKLERKKAVKATYFVLLSSDFYNVFSKLSNSVLRQICALGHNIGLHFDEERYSIIDEKDLKRCVAYEVALLEQSIDCEVNVVSMHRPSKWILENDIQLNGLINTYSKIFLRDFKYLSDSRMRWREDVIGIINGNKVDKLHILTHPFWYAEGVGNIRERLDGFMRQAVKERYHQVNDNFTDLERIIVEEDLEW